MFESLLIIGAMIFAILMGVLITLLIWNKPVVVIYMQLGYTSIMRFFITQIHLPDFIKYLSDYFTVILFIQIVLHFNKTRTLNIRKPMFFIILFIIISIISTLSNGASLIFFIWGARVYFRFFIYFLACTIFLKKENIDKLMNFLLILLPINTIVALFQYVVLGLEDDYVGGLYGIELGCNAEMNLYLVIVTVISIFYYINNKYHILQLIGNLSMICLISAVSELKFTFILIALIIIFSLILYFPKFRAIKMFFTCFSLLIVGASVFFILYPYWLDSIQSFESFIYETTVSSNTYDNSLGRFNVGPYLFQNILLEPYQRLLGIGFGNSNRFLIFTSSFFNRYEVLKYENLTLSLILIEIGLLGLITYLLFFVSIVIDTLRIKRKLSPDLACYCYTNFIVLIMIFIIIVYNSSMYMDSAFIAFFIISLPFILERELLENKISLLKQPLQGV